MIKQKLFYQEKGSITVYAIATVLCFLIILSAIFFSSSVIRKNQLKTLNKIKQIYAKQLDQADEIIENRNKLNTNEYVKSGLQVFYDAINNTGSGHNNNTKVWRDLSGNGNDAKWKGTSTTQLTWNDKSYDFINPNSNYFESTKNISLGSSSRTIELVCSLEEDGVKNVIGFGTSSSNTLNDLMYINNGINLNIGSYGTGSGIDNAFDNGRTYFSSISYNSSNRQTIYYRNAESKTNTLSYSLSTGSTLLNIGIGKNSSNNTNKRLKIHAVRIYNRVLTVEERKKNYELDKARYEIEEDIIEEPEEKVKTFAYTGAVQEWSPTVTGRYKLEVWGAEGGINSQNTGKAGKGGYSIGTAYLEENLKIYVYVGGQGSNTKQPLGGFNSGNGTSKTNIGTATGGGGASDIRINNDSLYCRVIVAGGGGGQGTNTGSGGHGGGTAGGNGLGNTNMGKGGTQISGGIYPGGTDNPAKFGIGGWGPDGTTGGQGGGGWYGGSFGTRTDGGGAGGSGWIYTESTFNTWKSGNSTDAAGWLLNSSYYLTDAQTIAGNTSMPTHDGTSTMTGNSGNGYAKITWIGK